MFNNPFPNAFGLDISDLSVKLVQLRNQSFLRRKPVYSLATAKSISLPPGLIVNGELLKPEEVRRRLQHFLQGNEHYKPITSPWVVAALPESQTFIKLVHTNIPTEKLIEDDIRALAKKHIPFEDNDNYYIRWQIMPEAKSGEQKTRILIGAASKSIADNYTYLLESLGLGVIALEIEALAIARAMITAMKEYGEEARTVLNLGATRSNLIVYDHDIVQFSTSLPFSGEILTTALSQQLHISMEEAEKIKIKQGLGYQNQNKKVWEIISGHSEQLIKYIKEAIEFYYSHFPQANRITRIIMCGGGSNLNRLDKIISFKLKILARPGRPWKNLNNNKSINMTNSESLRYATAIGLALRAADNPFISYDSI